MHSRERTLMPATEPFEGATVWVVPSPLPDLQTAFSRRAALFGPVAGAAAAMLVPPPAKALTHPVDAELIEFARCTVALAQHQEQVAGQVCAAQGEIDRWDFANKPKAPVLPERPSRMVGVDLSTATHRIMQFIEPIEDGAAQEAAACLAYKAAREDHERAVADKVATSQVPSLTALSDRLWQDLISSVERLTDMQPRTLAGLAAKASVIEALAENDTDIADYWGQNLSRSLAEDAIRLHAYSVPV